MAKSATERKTEQRTKLAASGGLRHELVLTQQETRILERNRQRRNPDRAPYSRNEYISLLILCDDQRLNRQEAACWFTRDCLSMNLTSAVTGHANLEGE